MMATNRQQEAARRNLAKARQAQSARAHGEDIPRHQIWRTRPRHLIRDLRPDRLRWAAGLIPGDRLPSR
jgi:hypothetical protein